MACSEIIQLDPNWIPLHPHIIWHYNLSGTVDETSRPFVKCRVFVVFFFFWMGVSLWVILMLAQPARWKLVLIGWKQWNSGKGANLRTMSEKGVLGLNSEAVCLSLSPTNLYPSVLLALPVSGQCRPTPTWIIRWTATPTPREWRCTTTTCPALTERYGPQASPLMCFICSFHLYLRPQIHSHAVDWNCISMCWVCVCMCVCVHLKKEALKQGYCFVCPCSFLFAWEAGYCI